MITLLVAGVMSVAALQRPAAVGTAFVLDGATVVDVEHGTLRPARRVVIVGNHIQAVGTAASVTVPRGARVIDARGKYLIPGLWDLHVHPLPELFYPLLLANGITGFRDAWAFVPLDTMVAWRRAILAGTRIGPPRQILSGVAIDEAGAGQACVRTVLMGHVCVAHDDSADAHQLVTALKAAGADMIKMYGLSPAMYFRLAAEARQAGLPFGGHTGSTDPAINSDSGARTIDHWGSVDADCWGDATLEHCQQLADRFRRNHTWWVPTFVTYARGKLAFHCFGPHFRAYWATITQDQPPDVPVADSLQSSCAFPGAAQENSPGRLSLVQRTGFPILAGTDVEATRLTALPPGFALHAELALFVAEGMTPLMALQSATLNPAKAFQATDSLGTVSRGKLADLVLLDANPLADIANTAAIRAVVANGRYFDRAALDDLLAEARTRIKATKLPIPVPRGTP